MRRMTSGLRSLAAFVVAVAGLGLGVAACDDKGGADKFVGTWTYAGAIDPKCIGANVTPIDLTGETATITKTDSSHVSVALGTICMVTFEVDGSTATAAAGQSCMFEIPGIGPATASITKWTLTISGETITSDFSSSVLVCAPGGVGTLTRAPDGGAAAN
jgi:hypothetical protein